MAPSQSPTAGNFFQVGMPSTQIKKPPQQPSLLACIPCRSKHLKCDAQIPICGRCTKTRQPCVYRESQRGYRRGTRNDTNKSVDKEVAGSQRSSSKLPQAVSGHRPSFEDSFPDSTNALASFSTTAPPFDDFFDLGMRDSDFNNLANMTSTSQSADISQLPDTFPPSAHVVSDIDPPRTYTPAVTSDKQFGLPQFLGANESEIGSKNVAKPPGVISTSMTSSHGSVRVPISDSWLQPDHLIDAFYAFFHPAHPFIVPRSFYMRNPSSVASSLKAAMQFTGSHFLPGCSETETLRYQTLVVELPSAANDGTKVQAMLLVAMTLFARFEQSDSRSLMGQAIDLALGLHMYQRDFPSNAGHGDPTLEESWRRTWWELYTVSCLMTALSGPAAIWPLHNLQSDVPLPCEEEDYRLCRPVTSSRTALEMQIREFLTDESVFSSFAYKIEATRLLGKVLALGSDTDRVRDSAVESLDGELSNFLLSLPPEKRELVEKDGVVDEVLFNSHVIINWALILLHRPRSWLSSGLQHYETACTLGAGTAEGESREKGESVSICDPLAVHTSKAISAASQILKAATLRTPMKRHSPCFICVAASAAVVLLPAYALERDVQTSQALQGRLQVAINSLTRIGEVWPLATVVKSQVTEFAGQIFFAGGKLAQPAFWSSTSNGGSMRNGSNVMIDGAWPRNTSVHAVNDSFPA
jgi:Fungal Zn(2)-Cys(6) binuclear cluster domain/Fungal specific transcription factor domain